MSDKAKELLKKMIEVYNSSHEIEFDNTFYIGYDDSTLNELYNAGYIEFKDNIVGSIILQVDNL